MVSTSNFLRRAWWVLTVVVLLLPLPSESILDLLCSAPGYANLEDGDKDQGTKDIGWDRIEPANLKWAKAVWAVTAINGATTIPTEFQPELWFKFVKKDKDLQGPDDDAVLDGYVMVKVKQVQRSLQYLQTLVIWAVDENHQTIGEIFKLKKIDDSKKDAECGAGWSDVFRIDPNYVQWNIPCGAVSSGTPTVPGIAVVMARMQGRFQTTRYENEFRYGPDWQRYSESSFLWRSPAQTYCYRPKQFRFVVAVTPEQPWYDWYRWRWPPVGTNAYPKPTSMRNAQPRFGFELYRSSWINPKYFGIPSRLDLDGREKSSCFGDAGDIQAGHWVGSTAGHALPPEWFSEAVWQGPRGSPDWMHPDIVKRSTCKTADLTTSNAILSFRGRCKEKQTVTKTQHMVAGLDNQMTCDYQQGSTLGDGLFKEEYRQHLERFERWLQADCECLQSVKGQVQHYKKKMVDMFKGDSGEEDEDFLPPVKKEHKVKPIGRQSISRRANWDKCPRSEMTDQDLDKVGICLYDKAGIVTYGVRQWHGIASLVQTFICTAVSITVARYCKGDVRLTRGRIPIRGWYLTHMLKLTAPTVWMWVTGTFAMTRQTEVVGVSYTHAARVHRVLGTVAFGLFWFNFVTGFLRPINRRARFFVIHLHWWGGVLQHVLELYLCFNSYQIPGSPSQRYSYLNMSFRFLWQQRLPVFVFCWIITSFVLHILMTSRQARVDMVRHGKYRCMFPIIKPFVKMTSREERRQGRSQRRKEIEDRLKEMEREELELGQRKEEGPWREEDERAAQETIQKIEREEQLLAEELEGMDRMEDDDANEEEDMDYLLKLLVYLYAFGCVVMVCVSVVSLYQEHSDHLMYGLGPMTCTHYSNLTLKSPNDTRSLC